jgi:ornithine decarboxylase
VGVAVHPNRPRSWIDLAQRPVRAARVNWDWALETAAMSLPETPRPSDDGLRSAAAQVASTPVLLMDLDRVEAQFRALREAMPEAHILYAVKANPHGQVLERLAALGCGFDIASPGELELCRTIAGPLAFLSYGNPIKKAADIAAARAAGVDLFAVDSPLELEKIGRAAPGARVFTRLAVSGAGAEWPLTHKFGCTVDDAVDLLTEAKRIGLKPAGVSFHVGSQQTEPEAWRHAIHRAGEVFHKAARRSLALEVLNLGGGLPAHYSHPLPPLETYAETMRAALRETFGAAGPKLFIEPGRYMVGDAGILVAEVVLTANRPHERVQRWVYLDVGVWTGLDETMEERIRYRLEVPGPARPCGPVVLAGPTCDSADVLYRHQVELPLDLRPGERVFFLSAGAYTACCSTVAFNGFPPLPTICL